MRREPDADRDAKHAGVPLRRVRAVEELGRLFSTPSRPDLRAAACGGRPRPANQSGLRDVRNHTGNMVLLAGGGWTCGSLDARATSLEKWRWGSSSAG